MLAGALGLALSAAASGAAAAPLVSTIVADPLTGVAIEGYDPVGFFTDGEALPGLPVFHHEWGGVPWYFTSAANRDVFMRAPEVYAPRFGGYCAMSLARGYLSDGRPMLHLVYRGKLYLFHSTANREAFLASPEAALAAAEAAWPALAADLIGPPVETGANP